MGGLVKCPRCGEEGDGRFCARCGTALAPDAEVRCPSCGIPAEPEALYCVECGEPLRERTSKGWKGHVPWILSGLALTAFAVAIAFFVQSETSPRRPGDPPTGGVISGGSGMMEGVDPSEARTEAGGGMPSASELAQMPPREAADRLFNRAMALREEGDPGGRAGFFAQMGVRAYQRVPPDQVDPDLRFHLGLLQIVQGDPAAAAAQADTILAGDADHLLGLLLAARAAGAAGDEAAADRWRDSLAVVAPGADLEARPEYRAHRNLIEEAADRAEGD